MPGGLLNAAPRLALVGKLPAHGDFVRRGDSDLVQWLDDWLIAEIEKFVLGVGETFGDHLAAMPAWCFAVQGALAGAFIASWDKVDRIHPVIACLDAPGTLAPRIAAVLIAARDTGVSADETSARLRALVDEPVDDGGAGAGDEGGWWLASDGAAGAILPPEFPTDLDFERLFEREG